MDDTFWHRQSPDQPLFPEVDWARPQSRARGGKLLIIGGNRQAFHRVAQAFAIAQQNSVGEIKVAVPDSLRTVLSDNIPGCVFLKSNASGGVGLGAKEQLSAYAEWADSVLIAGDLGRNSETPQVLDSFVSAYSGPLTITTDGAEAMAFSYSNLLDRPESLLVITIAQMQKFFKETHQTTAITSDMGMVKLAETFRELTKSHSISLTTFYESKLISAHQGQIATTPYEWSPDDPAWRLPVATKQTAYWMQHKEIPFKALAAAHL
ncbi:MAG: hypothetical protein R3313_03565 [Candidatus Saccharimonadales bacterium]|nr:hypothetical protein [Candidatus Saccharimonadales bacterium]